MSPHRQPDVSLVRIGTMTSSPSLTHWWPVVCVSLLLATMVMCTDELEVNAQRMPLQIMVSERSGRTPWTRPISTSTWRHSSPTTTASECCGPARRGAALVRPTHARLSGSWLPMVQTCQCSYRQRPTAAQSERCSSFVQRAFWASLLRCPVPPLTPAHQRPHARPAARAHAGDGKASRPRKGGRQLQTGGRWPPCARTGAR